MDPIPILIAAIERISEPRLFATERGYQGELLSEIKKLMGADKGDFARPFAEQEYQKNATHHGITFRPDIILHIPFDRGVSPTRRHDNFLVIELKLSANQASANDDFEKLSKICTTLDYPVGAFVNIASCDLWLRKFTAKPAGAFTLHEFAVELRDGKPEIRSASA